MMPTTMVNAKPCSTSPPKKNSASAVQELEQQQGLQCVSIVTLADLIEALSRPSKGAARISAEQLTALRAYQQRYGAT